MACTARGAWPDEATGDATESLMSAGDGLTDPRRRAYRGGNRETQMSDTIDLDAAAGFAAELADAARPIALRWFRTPLDIERKGDESPVTIADRAIEDELRARIRAAYPDHAILGEERGQEGSGRYTWVIDPIDGTKSFITGLPLFGTLIALADAGRPVLGVIDAPATGERWVGTAAGTSFGNAPARASGCRSLAEARLYTTSPDFFDAATWPRYDALSRRAAFRRFGGDCYPYGLLASGHCDLVIEASLQPYDFMALAPVVEGAGGVITDWEGRPLTIASGPRVIAAATRELLDEVLGLLNA